MSIKLFVSLKGLARAIEKGEKTFVGMFERPHSALGIYMEIEFPLAAVTVTEDVPYGRFFLSRFVDHERHAFDGGGVVKGEFKFIPKLKEEIAPQPPIEPAPHVANI